MCWIVRDEVQSVDSWHCNRLRRGRSSDLKVFNPFARCNCLFEDTVDSLTFTCFVFTSRTSVTLSKTNEESLGVVQRYHVALFFWI